MVCTLVPASFVILGIFTLGYLAIIAEHSIQINKTAVALCVAAISWGVYFLCGEGLLADHMEQLGKHLSEIAAIVFFLMGAMTIVELIDVHGGFKVITDLVHTSSNRVLFLLVAVISFFLSAVLDNLTTTILMLSLLRKLIPEKHSRFLFSCIVVVAANAGGAWTPIGDVTTTMLWIHGQISSLGVMKALFLPSLVSLAVPVIFYMKQLGKERICAKVDSAPCAKQVGSRLIFVLGILSLVSIPFLKAVIGLPPFMGALLGVGVLWMVTDFMHRGWEDRVHLKVPHVLSKIDSSSVLFFLGILLCVDALEESGILGHFARLLNAHIGSEALIATFIGIISAIIDNVPLVAATIGMYPLNLYPMDHTLWHMIAYTAGTGGSLLIIGSAAGVAMMGIEKVNFFSYLKKMTLPVFVGYLAGMAVYLLCT